MCKSYPDQFLVVEVDNQIHGFATFQTDSENSMGIIDNNAVAPDAQGKGLGKLLHQAVLNEFRKRGFTYAQVLTGLDPAHDAARGSYLKEGFSLSYSYGVYHREWCCCMNTKLVILSPDSGVVAAASVPPTCTISAAQRPSLPFIQQSHREL